MVLMFLASRTKQQMQGRLVNSTKAILFVAPFFANEILEEVRYTFCFSHFTVLKKQKSVCENDKMLLNEIFLNYCCLDKMHLESLQKVTMVAQSIVGGSDFQKNNAKFKPSPLSRYFVQTVDMD